MPINLKTNNADVLSLSDISRAEHPESHVSVIAAVLHTVAGEKSERTKTHFRCTLEARSQWLSICAPFEFYGDDLDRFIAELRAMETSLGGEASIDFHYEPPTLTLAGNGRGGILVTCDMFDAQQRAQVQFETDQTCLAPLIHDLEALKAMTPIVS